MLIKDLKANQVFEVIEGTVTDLGDVRTFQKFGKPGRVCNGKIKDESGDVKLTLWNDQIDQVKEGMKLKISNGYVGEWQGNLQVSTGRNGTLEIVGQAEGGAAEEPAEPDPADVEELEISEEDL